MNGEMPQLDPLCPTSQSAGEPLLINSGSAMTFFRYRGTAERKPQFARHSQPAPHEAP
jgi:hypothetical protein